MSYDAVEVLARFAEQYAISYPLLSDMNSRVIRELGLENRVAEAQNQHFGLQTDDRHVGMPHPGTFHLDEAGVITAKWFEQSHRVRPSGSVLLSEGGGGIPMAVSDGAEVSSVAVEAGLGTETYHPQQIYRLRVRLGVPEGQHVYVGPVPDGFVTLGVDLSGPSSLVAEPARLPEGETFVMEGLGERFRVVDGLVEVDVPFRIDEDEGDTAVELELAFQSCTGQECFPPVAVSLRLPLRSGGLLRRT